MTVVLEQPSSARPRTADQLRVALVNNMPDSAFGETEQQFGALLDAGSVDGPVVLARYVLPGVQRGAVLQAEVAEGYRDIRHLYRCPPDVLIVTGAEPRERDLTDEAYWPALEDLLGWARSEVPATFASCLAAHAALWAFDGLERHRLPVKCTGAFPQVVDENNPLVAGMGPFALPHSRWNDVSSTELESQGYTVLARCAGGSWSLASAARGQCSLLLSQGHPEYDRLTLLREYRRDVRRHLSGQQPAYPSVPSGYLDAAGTALLEQFATQAMGAGRAPELASAFPFEEASRHVVADWQAASGVLFRNWLRSVRQRAERHSSGETGA